MEKLLVCSKLPKGEDGCRVFSIRIRAAMVAELEAAARKTGHTRNELIGLFLDYALKNYIIQE